MFYSNVLYDTMKSIFLTEPFKCSDKYLKKELYWVIYCYDLKEKNTTIDFTFETMLVSFPVKLLLLHRMIIGDYFIKSFNLSLFDYTNTQISFYSDQYKISTLSSYKDIKKLIQSLYIYIEFILCVNIIIYIILLNSIIEMRINF